MRRAAPAVDTGRVLDSGVDRKWLRHLVVGCNKGISPMMCVGSVRMSQTSPESQSVFLKTICLVCAAPRGG